MNYTSLSSFFNERSPCFISSERFGVLIYFPATQMRFDSISLSISDVFFLPLPIPAARSPSGVSKPSIFVCLKNSRQSTLGWRRSNGGASAKMLFERQSGLAARPAGCYIIHIYTFTRGPDQRGVRFTPATCRSAPAVRKRAPSLARVCTRVLHVTVTYVAARYIHPVSRAPHSFSYTARFY